MPGVPGAWLVVRLVEGAPELKVRVHTPAVDWDPLRPDHMVTEANAFLFDVAGGVYDGEPSEADARAFAVMSHCYPVVADMANRGESIDMVRIEERIGEWTSTLAKIRRTFAVASVQFA
jgi:hypothetical protein